MKFVFNDGGRAEAGFKGETEDCVCRAIAIATEKPYKEVYDTINEFAKNERTGKRKRGKSNARTGVYKPTIRKVIDGYSSTATIKTLGGSVISSVNTFTADDETAKLTFSATVYNTSYTHTLVIKNGNTTVLTITGLKLNNGSNTITLTEAQRTAVLVAMASIKSFTGTFELKTFSSGAQIGTASTKTATVQTTVANSAPIFTGFSL